MIVICDIVALVDGGPWRQPYVLGDGAITRAAVELVEFALIAPVLLMLLMGMFDMGYNYYMQSQLQGAVQKASRDATVQALAGDTTGIDERVAHAVREIVPSATLTFSRRAYSSFSDVHRPEDFTDIDNNGTCNDGEPFEDANDNGTWDQDRGSVGGGGARDAGGVDRGAGR